MGTKKRGLFLLVLVVILLVFTVVSVSAGCYTFIGNDETLYCQPGVEAVDVQADCDANNECDMEQYFEEGSDCSEFNECQQVTCDVDCQTHALGWCQDLGLRTQFQEGAEVTNFNLQCTPGCCRVLSDTFNSCNFGVNEYQCNLRGFRANVPLNEVTFVNTPGMDQVTCQEQLCQASGLVLIELRGIVTDENGEIPSAEVNLELQGAAIQAEYDPRTGAYLFERLAIGSHVIRVTAAGYEATTFTVDLTSDLTELVRDVTINTISGAGVINGRVVDDSGVSVEGALVSWGSGLNDRTLSATDGSFSITLTAGTYTLRVSKDGFTSAQQANIILTDGETLTVEDIVLMGQQFQGIAGVTQVDFDGFGEFEETAAVRIFVDGVFKGFSQTGGMFQIELVEGEHTITASFEFVDEYQAEPVIVNVRSETTENVQLFLSAPQGECSVPGTEKSVEQITATAVPGRKEVSLKWKKPCPEVLGYELKKFHNDAQVGVTESFTATKHAKVDAENFEWGETYTYEITALYEQGRISPEATVVSITLGNPKCEGKYDEINEKWATFCEVGTPKQVLICNNDNQIITWNDCTERDVTGESDFYCARISSTAAECRDAGACFTQESRPFGLYHTAEMCYGTNNPSEGEAVNFCYYDFSDKTITNVCESCVDVNCFDYKSEEACIINSCAAEACEWVDSAAQTEENSDLVDYSLIGLNIPTIYATLETGTGYCVAENYGRNELDLEGDDYCSLCGPEASIFENYFCTADVCTNLGRCFSNPPSQGEILSSCLSCGEVPTQINNCYAYQTELECNGGVEVQNQDGQIFQSADSCGWGRCRWNGASCVKDGDASEDDDCVSFTGRERTECVTDINPPETVITPDGLTVVSHQTQEVTFQATDKENLLSTLNYCLIDSESSGSCDLDENLLEYPGRDRQETLSVNILAADDISGREINGETFLLRYFSKDKYFNQENVKESFIFVDNVRPDFEISEDILTIDDLTNVNVRLQGLREAAKCTFLLEKKIPAGVTVNNVIERSTIQKTVNYENLDGISYELNVTCEDDYGNIESKTKLYVFDLEERIDIIFPRGAVAKTSIVFRATTQVGATCELIDKDNQKVADFITDQTGKDHQTVEVPGFFEGEYAAEYKIVCRELLDATEIFEEYFDFSVDFSPPSTQIVLTEGSREARPIVYGWEEFFIMEADVDFECESGEGFSCDKTFFCLGDDCDFVALDTFSEYTQTINLEESSRICYYSTDVAGNQVIQAICGTVTINGYGITLELPIRHRYNDDIWGVSSTPTFTWQFSTRVPTTECRFDFRSGFDYNNLPAHKILSPNSDGKYVVENFPDSVFSTYPGNGGLKRVFVQCINSDNEIGPEQLFNLEFDPTAPEILSAFAKPNRVVTGITTDLTVTTNDKSLCKYSDNSEGEGSGDYQTMEFSFPGTSERVLGEVHEDIFNIDFVGESKEYLLNTQCVNGAGDTSEVEEIAFSVDYSDQGNIIDIFPDGQHFPIRNVGLRVETNKNAVCEFSMNDTYEPFETVDDFVHTKELVGLEEGEHVVAVRCLIENEVRNAQLKFFVDLTPPLITEVEDGNYSCGAETLSVFVHTNETNISSYSYEVLDRGVERILTRGPTVLTGTTSSENPILIPTSELLENHTYTIKVIATDAAENVGRAKESNGIMIVSLNHSACEDDGAAPLIDFVESDSLCSSASVEMRCTDRVGCSTLRYGKSATVADCLPTLPYSGRKIEFDKTGWICYFVEDVLGNNHTELKEVVFQDEDGDGIKDSCDECEGTKPGKVVGILGCADSELSKNNKRKDSDGDSLPDDWENLYNSLDCPLALDAIDSDGDGLSDNREDYDDDGRTNFEEFIDETNPCKVDQKSPVGPGIKGGPVVIDESNLLPWVLLIIGVLFMGGGMGYLIYYYNSGSKMVAVASGGFVSRPTVARLVPAWKRNFLKNKKERLKKSRARRRRSIFGGFSKTSNGVKQVARVKPSSKKQQANVFDKLESLSGKKKEPEDIFSKLKNIARKGK
jgi:hypothetical protein